ALPIYQAGEGTCLAIMRGGREHDQGIGAAGQQLRQLGALRAGTTLGDVMCLVDDDDVPVGPLQVAAVFIVLLEGVDGDDRLVVVVEGVVVARNIVAH